MLPPTVPSFEQCPIWRLLTPSPISRRRSCASRRVAGNGPSLPTNRAMAAAAADSLFFLFLYLLVSPSPGGATTAHPGYPQQEEEAECGLRDLTVVRREEYGGGRIVDISHAYREEMPGWEREEGLGRFLRLTRSMDDGDVAYFSELRLPAHSGTHVDAPGHVFRRYYDAGFDVDTLDLDVLNGPALLVDVPRDKNITAEVMKSLHIPKGARRVLFRTLNTDRQLMWKTEFDTSYVGFMKDGARWLVDNTDVKLVGVDYLSVATWDDLIPSHLVFLQSREIILVEALKLDHVEAGIYDLHCLPLRLRGAEGSPIRCILIK